MPVEHVIFDCDGVLVDSEWLTCEGGAQLFSSLGAEITPGYVRDNFIGMANETMFAAIEKTFGIAVPGDFEMQHQAMVFELFESNLQAIPGIGVF